MMDEDYLSTCEYHSDHSDEDNNELKSCTPPDLIQTALATKKSLLPDKSKTRYEKPYDEFIA